MRAFLDGTVRGLSSRIFSGLVLAWFAIQAGLIAFVSSAGMYDEHYHLAAIRAFSRRWTPFITQVPGDGALGDAERYGSYLYHYLLSFPLRVSELIGLSESRQVLVLRLVTVAMVTLGLLAWRWLFRELGASRALANVCMMIVSATPLLVFLAGFVNYDNMLFLIVPLFLRSAVRLYKAEEFSPRDWLLLAVFAGMGALTKYTFLPFLPVVGLVVLVRQVKVRGRAPRGSLRRFVSGDGVPGRRRTHIALLVAALVAVGLVAERYLGNIILFGAVMPDCLTVHDLAICSMHAPWARNQELDAGFADVAPSLGGAIAYLTSRWIPVMLYNSTWFGAVWDPSVVQSRGPHVTGIVLYVAIAVVLVTIFLSIGALRRHRGSLLILATSFAYLGALFAQNYSDYTTLGVAIGIAGRYALVVLPVFVILAGIGAVKIFTATWDDRGTAMKVAVVALIVVLGTQGGGITGYLWNLDESWLQYPDGRLSGVALELNSVVHTFIVPDDWVMDPRAIG